MHLGKHVSRFLLLYYHKNFSLISVAVSLVSLFYYCLSHMYLIGVFWKFRQASQLPCLVKLLSGICFNPFTAKGKCDQTKKTSKSWTIQRNLKVWPLKWKLSMSTFWCWCLHCCWADFMFGQFLCLIWTETWQWRGWSIIS